MTPGLTLGKERSSRPFLSATEMGIPIFLPSVASTWNGQTALFPGTAGVLAGLGRIGPQARPFRSPEVLSIPARSPAIEASLRDCARGRQPGSPPSAGLSLLT